MSEIIKQNNNRAVIYCRVSTKDQVEEGNSLTTQQRVCKEYCLKNGYEIAEIFIEKGESAKTADRTELQKLLVFCANKRNNISLVIFYKIDRFARDRDDYGQLKIILRKYNVEVKSTSENFDNSPVGRFIENSLANIAQFDNDVRTERSVGGMREAVHEGRYVWSAPLGYNNVKIAGRSTIAPDSKLFPLVRRAFELIAKRVYPPEEVRQLLQKEGLVNRKNKPISKSIFYYLLKNEVYTGWIDKFGERHKGLFEPLITEELFWQVQRVLKNKGKKGITHITDRAEFSLRRFIQNGNGQKLSGCWSRGRNKKYPYYKFPGKNANYARDKFEISFMKFMDNYKIPEKYHPKLESILTTEFYRSTKQRRAEVDKLKSLLNSLNSKQSALIDKNLNGVIGDGVLKTQLSIIQEQTMQINDTLFGFDSAAYEFDSISGVVKEYLAKPSKVWQKMPVETKVKLLWFEFPAGVIFENNSFRTKETAFIFNPKSTFFISNSYKVNFNVKSSNNPELTYSEKLNKLRLQIKALSEILNSSKPPV